MDEHMAYAYATGLPYEDTPDVCVFCGEEADVFEDGLRCKMCAEQQDEENDEGGSA